MPSLIGAFAEAPRVLLWLALASGAISSLVSLWLARRFMRGLFGRTQASVGLWRYALALILAGGGALTAVASLALCAALSGYRAFTARTKVAEVQCMELAPQKLRLFYTPVGADGKAGESATYDLDGDEWTVGGEVLRFRPTWVALGVPALHAVTRIEGRWQHAEDANRHHGTAYDVGKQGDASWTWLKRNGTRGPLQWIVSGAHGQAVSQLPDRRAVYDLFITPNGYVVDKRSL